MTLGIIKYQSIECDLCHVKFEYETEDNADSIDVLDVPDGYFVDGIWICDECGSCKYCETSLEKRPKQRGKNNARECDNDDCIRDMRDIKED